MQNNQIIYSSKPPSLMSKLCSCLKIFKRQKLVNYHPEIDTPKSSFLGQKKLIVLDLDETLVHSQFQPTDGYDFSVDIVVQQQDFKVYVHIRPGVQKFLEQMHYYYDIVLWTASLKEYAMPVMDYIDPDRKAVERLYRDSCTQFKGGLTKDLTKLGRDLKDVIIVDNSILSFSLNPENGFKIKDFFFDRRDNELSIISPFLIWISQLPDVRPVNLQYEQFMNSSSEQLNQRKNGSIIPVDQKFYGISRSVTIQRERIKKTSLIRTLTLSHDDDEERFERIINSPKVQDQTSDSEKETFEIGT